ncbi:MAG TPA: HNH endonuclease [bacterium]|nr:HNH endonuclease [bacterium]
MSWDDDRLNEIYDKTYGRCHICQKRLSFINYGRQGRKGAWEVEHSNPRAEGGTDNLNNLYPACINCNRSKGTRSSRSARAVYGLTRAPYSRQKKLEKKKLSALRWMIGLGAVGLLISGWGAVAGACIGGVIGYNQDPDED